MRNVFRQVVLAVAVAAAAFMPAKSAHAQALVADCAQDIAKYCSNVLPGSDRIVACLISFEDRIAPRCRLTAYLESGTLGVRLQELKSFAKTCSSDILQYCSGIPAGGGRILDCLKKNQATLTDDCRAKIPTAEQFMKD